MTRKDRQHLGEVVAELRRARRASQREVGVALGLDPSAISRVESGERDLSAEELAAAAGYFGITVDSLLTGDALEAAPGFPNGDLPFAKTLFEAADRLRGSVESA